MRLWELEPLLQALIGKQVTAKTIAGNSIVLWFNGAPQSPEVKELWIDPPWRIQTDVGIESSSYGFPYDMEDGETEIEYRARFDAACENSDCLKGTTIQSIRIDHSSSDIEIKFSNGRSLQNFPVDLTDENWHFTDHATRRRYGVSVIEAQIRITEP